MTPFGDESDEEQGGLEDLDEDLEKDEDDALQDRKVTNMSYVTKTAVQSVAHRGTLYLRSMTTVYWKKRYIVLLRAPYRELRCFHPLRTHLASEVIGS